MPRKPTKSSLTNKLDAVCSRIVRSSGVCEFCGNTDYEKLQCAHIYSRTYRATRWNLRNLICLCASCHFYSHKNPLWFAKKVKRHLGEVEYELLEQSHQLITKNKLDDLVQLLEKLELLEATMYAQGYSEPR